MKRHGTTTGGASQPTVTPVSATTAARNKRKVDTAASPRRAPRLTPLPSEPLRETAAASSSSAAAPGNAVADADADEPIFQGSTGKNSLLDFPHARANCLAKPFVEGDEDKCFEACPNCYCYVCDTPVAACEEWSDHCCATHGVSRWDQMRAAKAAEAKQQHAKQAAAVGGSSSSSSTSASPALLLSADELLAALEAVFPIETPEPAGLSREMTLRPYQRQSLAFAESVESDPMLASRGGFVRGGFICDEMG